MTTLNLKSRYGGAALVTGASAGIGEAFARRLAAEGMDLILVARRKERLEALARELEPKFKIKVHVFPYDLAEADAHTRLAGEIDELTIDIGLLINNAGFGSFGPFAEADPAYEARMVDLNCRAVVSLTRVFLPKLLARRRGGIIIVASAAGYQGMPFTATYAATKAFDLHFGEALWSELRGTGIDVLALSPGYTATEFQQVAGSFAKPGLRVATPDEVVEKGLSHLGKGPSVIQGWRNVLATFMNRLLPRRAMIRLIHFVSDPAKRPKK